MEKITPIFINRCKFPLQIPLGIFFFLIENGLATQVCEREDSKSLWSVHRYLPKYSCTDVIHCDIRLISLFLVPSVSLPRQREYDSNDILSSSILITIKISIRKTHVRAFRKTKLPLVIYQHMDASFLSISFGSGLTKLSQKMCLMHQHPDQQYNLFINPARHLVNSSKLSLCSHEDPGKKGMLYIKLGIQIMQLYPIYEFCCSKAYFTDVTQRNHR